MDSDEIKNASWKDECFPILSTDVPAFFKYRLYAPVSELASAIRACISGICTKRDSLRRTASEEFATCGDCLRRCADSSAADMLDDDDDDHVDDIG